MKLLIVLSALFLGACCEKVFRLPPGPEAQACWKECVLAATKGHDSSGNLFRTCVEEACDAKIVCVEKK